MISACPALDAHTVWWTVWRSVARSLPIYVIFRVVYRVVQRRRRVNRLRDILFRKERRGAWTGFGVFCSLAPFLLTPSLNLFYSRPRSLPPLSLSLSLSLSYSLSLTLSLSPAVSLSLCLCLSLSLSGAQPLHRRRPPYPSRSRPPRPRQVRGRAPSVYSTL